MRVCCKDWSTNDVVAKKFYASLIPGVSIIIQQDYLHFQHPWVVATMEALYPRVKPVAYTAENSMIFACYESITTRDVEEATGMSNQLERVKQLIRRAQDVSTTRLSNATLESISWLLKGTRLRNLAGTCGLNECSSNGPATGLIREGNVRNLWLFQELTASSYNEGPSKRQIEAVLDLWHGGMSAAAIGKR